MNILADIQAAVRELGLPIETGVFSDTPPPKYMVVIPLADTFDLHADNAPGYDVQEARISLFSKSNYISEKNKLVKTLLSADFTVTDRRYIGYETDTGYHHYIVDVAKHYEMEG